MRQENSLQTAARWAGYGVVALLIFGIFSYTVGTIVWWVKLYQLRNKPRKYRKMRKEWGFYTDPAMGFAYLLLIVPMLFGIVFALGMMSLFIGEPFDKWWYHSVWGEPWYSTP